MTLGLRIWRSKALYTVHCVIAIQVSVFMSSYIGGRSGNRGRCAQPCRMEYDVCKRMARYLNPGNNKYVLSPKDICTLKILPEYY